MLTIISGAQTGVDRGALDAALENGIACGGWCPKGRKAEDGVIPERYPVTETGSDKYSVRTRKNVVDSDATVIIYFELLSGGTELTSRYCQETKRPCLLIDGSEMTPESAGQRIYEFVKKWQIEILNVAGPRASGTPGAHGYAQQAVTDFIKRYEYRYTF